MMSFLQGVCADQSKVCGYHRFQQAEFSQNVLSELRRLFEARSELLHQKVALHAYTALLSRLQVESYMYRLLRGERHESHSSRSGWNFHITNSVGPEIFFPCRLIDSS